MDNGDDLPAFVSKLYEICEAAQGSYINWNPQGDAFTITDANVSFSPILLLYLLRNYLQLMVVFNIRMRIVNVSLLQHYIRMRIANISLLVVMGTLNFIRPYHCYHHCNQIHINVYILYYRDSVMNYYLCITRATTLAVSFGS